MKILVGDIETTDFLPKGGKIVEVGLVSLDLSTGVKEIIYNKVFNPGLSREELATKWICENGYMTPEEILSGENLKACIPEIQKIVDEHPLGFTAFNRVFDEGFLKSEGVVFVKLLPCPMIIATPICKLPHPRGGKGYKWPKVQEAWDKFFGKNTGYVEKHRGADDAFHEGEIVYYLYKHGHFKIS